MNFEIAWSDQAKNQLRIIHDYFKEVAGDKIALSLTHRILVKPRILLKHPNIGQIEESRAVKGRGFRYLVEGNYKIIYKVIENDQKILIAAVFDTRQNPDKMRVNT